MSSTCLEPEGSSLGRLLYIQVWYSVFHMHQNKIFCSWKNVVKTELQPTYKTSFTDSCKTLYHSCLSNRLSENEPSGSKHVEDI